MLKISFCRTITAFPLHSQKYAAEAMAVVCLLPVVNDIDEALKKELLERIDTIVRNDEDIEKALDLVDQKLLVEVLGIDKNICISCRQIWKKMQKRRLGRG